MAVPSPDEPRKKAVWETSAARKAEQRAGYQSTFGGKKARWMGSGVVPPTKRMTAAKG